MAERWSRDGKTAQVSCFFSVNADVDEDSILELEHSIDGALSDAGVVQESRIGNSRKDIPPLIPSITFFISRLTSTEINCQPVSPACRPPQAPRARAIP